MKTGEVAMTERAHDAAWNVRPISDRTFPVNPTLRAMHQLQHEPTPSEPGVTGKPDTRPVAPDGDGGVASSLEAESMDVKEAATAIISAKAAANDPGWKQVANAYPGAVFYDYDYDVRTFSPSSDETISGSGAILASYRTEVFHGFTDMMSLSIPVVFDVDLRAQTFATRPVLSSYGR